MSAFQEHREELEHHEQMFGRDRGRLAVSLDRITNALVLVGQHGVYCTSQRNPTLPAMDLRMITQELTNAKELIQSVMEEMRKLRESSAAKNTQPVPAGIFPLATAALLAFKSFSNCAPSSPYSAT